MVIDRTTATERALQEIASFQAMRGSYPTLVVSAEFEKELREEWAQFQRFFCGVPIRVDAHPIADCVASSS
jgi:hypothetical protein